MRVGLRTCPFPFVSGCFGCSDIRDVPNVTRVSDVTGVTDVFEIATEEYLFQLKGTEAEPLTIE